MCLYPMHKVLRKKIASDDTIFMSPMRSNISDGHKKSMGIQFCVSFSSHKQTSCLDSLKKTVKAMRPGGENLLHTQPVSELLL